VPRVRQDRDGAKIKPKQLEVVKALIPKNPAEAKAAWSRRGRKIATRRQQAGRKVPATISDASPHVRSRPRTSADRRARTRSPLYVDTAGFKKVGGQSGSNPGGVYQGPNGRAVLHQEGADRAARRQRGLDRAPLQGGGGRRPRGLPDRVRGRVSRRREQDRAGPQADVPRWQTTPTDSARRARASRWTPGSPTGTPSGSSTTT
jgi:hypothetical protein